jgi:uncharacterized membrane protein affecting hemolysin expression
MTGLALWPLAKRFLPVLAWLAAFVAMYVGLNAWGNARFDAGVAKERAAWEQEASRLRAIAAQEAAQRAAAVNAANDAATRSQASLDALAAQSKVTHETYYRNRPVVRCLDPDRVRAISQADAAASAAAAAK